MTEPIPGLPAWRPGTPVRYWLNAREGDGQLGQTQGSPFIADGVPAVYIARHEAWIPLTRVEALDSEGKKARVDQAVAAIREEVEKGRDLHGAVTQMWTNSDYDTSLMEDAVEVYAEKYGV